MWWGRGELFLFKSHAFSCVVFVANPNKPEPILKILVKNKEKLAKFLINFHNGKASMSD